MAAMTANTVITKAAQRVNALAGEEALTAAEASDFLSLLNLTMHNFRAKGIHYSHVDLAAADTVNVPDEQLDNVIWLFAERVANEFARPLDANDLESIRQAKLELQAAYYQVPPAPADEGLIRRRLGTYNFARGV